MGLTKGYIFGASETVTNAKLHSLVDLGTVSGLVNAEVSATAGIVDTKLAQIATAQKVSATALTLLGSTPAAAGILPVANGGTGSATQNFVDLTTAQTVTGVKTFSSFPVTPSSAPASDYQAANKKYVDDTKPVFGSWVDKSASYAAQQAATDGFVVVHPTAGSTMAWYLYTDANADPTTLRGASYNYAAVSNHAVGFTCPVKKGDYWKLVVTAGTPKVWWIPLGS